MSSQALIFDCDGVLVDSEPLAVFEIAEMLRRHDVPILVEQIYDRFLGRSFQTVLDAAYDEHGVDLTDAVSGFDAGLSARLRRDLRPIKGIRDVLERLTGPRAVASSSALPRLELSLRVTGLADFFDGHVYSSAMVACGKPAPDLFLLAASRLGIYPAHCTVIEDSPAGIRAARAAGMRVVGFLGGSHAGPACLVDRLAAERPDALVESAEELPDTLAAWG